MDKLLFFYSCMSAHGGYYARINQFLQSCDINKSVLINQAWKTLLFHENAS